MNQLITGPSIPGMRPPQGIPNLGAKKPTVIQLIEVGGIYQFHLVGGACHTIRVDGGIPVSVHYNQEKNQEIQLCSLVTGSLMHYEDGKWVDSPGPIFCGLMFNSVIFWEVIQAPPSNESKEVDNVSST
jgi:hypothetical protein